MDKNERMAALKASVPNFEHIYKQAKDAYHIEIARQKNINTLVKIKVHNIFREIFEQFRPKAIIKQSNWFSLVAWRQGLDKPKTTVTDTLFGIIKKKVKKRLFFRGRSREGNNLTFLPNLPQGKLFT